jgi:hypothetical protein
MSSEIKVESMEIGEAHEVDTEWRYASFRVGGVEVGAEVIVDGPDAGCVRNVFAPGALSRDEGLDDALRQHLLNFEGGA